MAVLETMVGVAATAALGAVTWVARNVSAHNHAITMLPALRADVDRHSMDLSALSARQEERHIEVKSNLTEVKSDVREVRTAISELAKTLQNLTHR